MILRTPSDDFDEFCENKRIYLIENAVKTLKNSLALTGKYEVDMDVHPFPAHGFIYFRFKINHKDEDYSLFSRSAGASGFYIEPCRN